MRDSKENRADPIFLKVVVIDSFNKEISKEFIGTLTIPGTLRDCPSSDCEAIRYYAETAEIKIVGLDDSNEWYQVKPHDDYGNELSGWMHYSLFTQDYRNNFLETHLLSDEKGEEIQEKSIALLAFLKNKNFQVGLIITLIFMAFLLGALLLRKKIKIIFQFKEVPLSLRGKKITSNYYGIIIIFFILIGLVGTTYGAIDYQKTSKLLEAVNQLTKE